MNRDRYNDYEWYEGLVNHRNVTTQCRAMNNTGISRYHTNRRHRRNGTCCVNLWVTLIISIVFTVCMYAWLA